MQRDPPTPEPPAPAPPRSLCLPRETRVVRTGDFERAWKLGSRARGEVLLVVVVPNDQGLARLGLSVGKKVWKGAVQRNRVRRIFREAFRLTRHDLPAGHDYILVPAAPRLEPTLEATRRELARLGPKAALRAAAKAREGTPAP